MSFDPAAHSIDLDTKKILMPALNHFINSPAISISSLPMFDGAGVYALYIDNPENTIYSEVTDNNYPIYVGKAVPSGSRQGKIKKTARQLRGRLLEHRRSLEQGNLPVEHFSCRFLVMGEDTEDLIPAMESLLIKHYHPLWNSYIDGFGIHTPGKGRFNQQPSEWDTIHPGRPWLDKLTGEPRDPEVILTKIEQYKKRHI